MAFDGLRLAGCLLVSWGTIDGLNEHPSDGSRDATSFGMTEVFFVARSFACKMEAADNGVC